MLKIFQASRRQIDSISIREPTCLCLAWGEPLFTLTVRSGSRQVSTKYEHTYIHRPRIVAWCVRYWRKMDRVDFWWARYESLAFTTARENERNMIGLALLSTLLGKRVVPHCLKSVARSLPRKLIFIFWVKKITNKTSWLNCVCTQDGI